MVEVLAGTLSCLTTLREKAASLLESQSRQSHLEQEGLGLFTEPPGV